MKRKKKPKYKVIRIDLPGDVVTFYKKVAKLTGLSLSKVLIVVTAVAALRDLEKKV